MSMIFKPDFDRGPFGCIVPLMLYRISSIIILGPHVEKGKLAFVHRRPPSTPEAFNGLKDVCPIGSNIPTVEPTCAIPTNLTSTMDAPSLIDLISATTGVTLEQAHSNTTDNTGISLLAYFAFIIPLVLILVLATSLFFAFISLYITPGETGDSPVQNAAGDNDTPEDEHPCPATNVAGGSGGDRGRGGDGPPPPHAYIPSLKHDLIVFIIGFILGFLACAIVFGKVQVLLLYIGPILQDVSVLLCDFLSSASIALLRTFLYTTLYHIRRGMGIVTGIYTDVSEVEEDLEDWTMVQTPTPTKKKSFSLWSIGRRFGTPTGSPRRPARPLDSPNTPVAYDDSGSQGEQSPIHPPFPEVVSNRGIAQLLLDEDDVIPGDVEQEEVNRFPIDDLSVVTTSTPERDGAFVEEGPSFVQDNESANDVAATSDEQVVMGASDSILVYFDKKRYPYDYFPMRDDVNKESHNNGLLQNQNLNLRSRMADGDHPANTSDCTEESRVSNYSFNQDANLPTSESITAAENRSEKPRFMKACLSSPPSAIVSVVPASPYSEGAVPTWRLICATPPRQYPGGPFIIPSTPPSAPPTPEQLSYAPYKIAYTGDGSVVEADMDLKDQIWEARIEGTPLPSEESYAKNLFREAVENATKKLLETIPKYGAVPRVVVHFPTPPRNSDGSYNIPNTPPSAPASPETSANVNAPLRPSRSWDDVVSEYTRADRAIKYAPAPAGGSESSTDSPPREESVSQKLQFEVVPTRIPRPVVKGPGKETGDPFDFGKLRVVPRSRRATGTPGKRDD